MVKSRYKLNIKLSAGHIIILLIALLAVFSIIGIYAYVNYQNMQKDYISAQAEYEELRELVFVIEYNQTDNSYISEDTIPECSFTEINPDYIGWITVDRTNIDYPVVQGIDNIKYLDTTFNGETNPAGTIFMDYRSKYGFDSPLVIIYGHNMKDGTMFARLCPSLIKRNITITTKDRELLTYNIIAVRATDIFDPVFDLFEQDENAVFEYLERFNVPQSSNRLLVLSTCISGGNADKRLLIIAVLAENVLG